LIVVKQLFGEKTFAEILRYMDEVVPILPSAIDTQTFKRRARHNDPFFAHLHRQLSDFASEQFEVKLKPSYSFLSMYFEGGHCPLHIDRPQCFRTVDLLIRQTDDEPWPLQIGPPMTDDEVEMYERQEMGGPESHRPDGLAEQIAWQTALLEPNDAVLYSGTHQWHRRPTILSGSADLIFFHFVPEEFDGDLN
jgi:hypothetical protein